jgi:tetratricopeptide (TPR) repeat protein
MDGKKKLILSLAVIAVLGAAVYANSLSGQFVWDDTHLVKDNIYIRSFSNIPEVFLKSVQGRAGQRSNFYRPAQMLSYMIDYSVWKLNVTGYHITNTLLHIFAALCVFWLIFLLFKDILTAFLTGAFFVVHPVHTEAVTYISGRADSLALVFMLLTFILYVRSVRAEPKSPLIALVFLYALALLSRESSLILPVLLLLYHYAFKEKIKAKNFLPLCSLAVLYIIARMTFLKGVAAVTIEHKSTMAQRIPGFFIAVFNYIKLLIMPLGLHMEYGNEIFPLMKPEVFFGILLFLGITAAVFAKKSDKLIFFGFGFFLITLLPSSNIYPINAYMAEHWLYVPSIGIFLVASGAAKNLYERKDLRIPVILFCGGLIIFWGALTVRQNTYWRDPIEFYKRTLKYSPESGRVLNNISVYYHDKGEKEKAADYLKKAIEEDPDYAEPYSNLGLVYHGQGRYEDAIELYKKAVQIAPDYSEAYNNMGLSYDEIGRADLAADAYKKAMELKPDYAKPYYNLGNVMHDTKRYKEAVELYKKAIEINSRDEKPYYNLANAYGDMGKTDKAIYYYKKAVQVKPDYAKALNNLGNIYREQGKEKLAVDAYLSAIKVNPEDAFAYNNLGTIYASMKKFDLSLEAFKQSIRIMPGHPDLHFNLANIYRYLSRHEEAIDSYKKALDINPDYVRAYNSLAEVYFELGNHQKAKEYYNAARARGLINETLKSKLGL